MLLTWHPSGNDLRQFAECKKSTSINWAIGERINRDSIKRSQFQIGTPVRYTANFKRGDPIWGNLSQHTGPISQVRRATQATGLIPFIGWHPVKYRTAIFQWKNPKKHVLACQKPVFLDFGSPHWLLYIDQTEIGPSLYKLNQFLGVIIPKANFVAEMIQAHERRVPTQNYSFIASAWAKDIVTSRYSLSSNAAGVMQLKQRQIQQHQSVKSILEELNQGAAADFQRRQDKDTAREAQKLEVERIKAESRQRFSAEYWTKVDRLWREAIDTVAPGARHRSSTGHWARSLRKTSSVIDEIGHRGPEANALKARIKTLMITVGDEVKQCKEIASIHDSNFYASLENPLEVIQAHIDSAAKVAEECEQLNQDCYQFIQHKQAQQAEENKRQYQEMIAARKRKRTEASLARFSDDYWAEVRKSYIDCKTALASLDTYLFQSDYQKVIECALKATSVQGLTQAKEAEAVQSDCSDIRKALSVIERAESDSYVDLPDPLQTIKELLAKIEVATTRYKTLEQQFHRPQKEQRKAGAAADESTSEMKQGSFFDGE